MTTKAKPFSTKAYVTRYKVTPDELLDMIDALFVAETSAILTRCPGGRLIRDGYICGHCGQDPSMRYDAKGEPIYQRKAGEKVYARCGAKRADVLAKEDLTKMIPTIID